MNMNASSLRLKMKLRNKRFVLKKDIVETVETIAPQHNTTIKLIRPSYSNCSPATFSSSAREHLKRTVLIILPKLGNVA